MDLKQIKTKYSGQDVPQWELDRLEPQITAAVANADAPKRRGRPPNVKPETEVTPE